MIMLCLKIGKSEFEKYKILSFCSDNDANLKQRGKIVFTTDESELTRFLNNKSKQINYNIEKFINICRK